MVDENQVRRAGLAPVELAAQLQAALDGVQGGSILEATEELPVRLRLGEELRRSPADLYRLHLAGAVSRIRRSTWPALGKFAFEPSAGVIPSARANGSTPLSCTCAPGSCRPACRRA